VKHLQTADQLGPKLHVHPSTLRKLARLGKIPYHEIGGAIRFDEDEVLRYTSRKPACLRALKEAEWQGERT